MYVPISWLKEYVDLTLPVTDLAERITLAGLEVAGVTQVGDWWDPETLVVGQVLAVHEHPDADRLVLVDVDAGDPAPQRVVTGAPNLYQYKHASELPMLKVAFAKRGAVLVDAYSDERPRPKKKLKPAKIRGIKSEGMVCSELELGLSEEHEGIMLLAEDAPVGTPLSVYLGDQVLEVELTPDMARCLSMVGTAREVAALTQSALHLPADEADHRRRRHRRRLCGRGDRRPGPVQPLHRPDHPQRHHRPLPGVDAGSPAQVGHAPHQQHRGHHQLCHAGIGPAPPRLRLRSVGPASARIRRGQTHHHCAVGPRWGKNDNLGWSRPGSR